MTMKRILLSALLVASAAAASAAAAWAAEPAAADTRKTINIRLSGFREVPSIITPATGSATLRITVQAIQYELRYQNLEADATVAHIHVAQDGVNGGIAAFLCGGGSVPACPARGGTVTGTIGPAQVVGPAAQGVDPGEFADLLKAIRAGTAYVNVHSQKYPNGELRGDIRP